MITPFLVRLADYASAPHHNRLLPRRFGEVGVWTRQQEIVGQRRHQPRQWVYTNSERTAYHVSMHLLMRRMRRGVR